MQYRNNGVIKVIRNTRFPVGTTIDSFLTEEEIEVLYRRWDSENWDRPLEYQGGQLAITCDMIYNVPVQDLINVYGSKMAMKFRDVSKSFSTL